MTVSAVFALRGSAFRSVGCCGLGGWFRFRLRRRRACRSAPPRLHAAMLRARALLRLRTAKRAILAFGRSVLRRIRRLLCERGNTDCKDRSDERGSDKTMSDHADLLT